MKIDKKFGKIFLSLIISVCVFIGLLFLQQKFLTPNGTVDLVQAVDKIDSGTLITNENINNFFKIKSHVDGELEVNNSVKNKDDLLNKIVTKDIEKGSIISKNYFSEKDTILDKIENPVEASFKVNDTSQVVAGTLRKGNIINISVIDEISKESTEVLKNVYVDRVFNSEAKEINSTDDSPALTVVVIVSKEDEKNLNDNLAKGIIRVSRPQI